MEEKAVKFFDVDAVLKEKNPGLYKLLPGFIVNYIKKKIHQDFINKGLYVHRNKFHLEFNQAALEWMGAEVEWSGEMNIPVSGGVIICSNHPLGGLDGMALIKAVSSRRSDIRFLVNDILTKLENFRTLFVPVNKVGGNTKEALRVIDEIYSGSEAVLVFPAGLVSRKQQGKILDLEWKKSFIAKSIENKKSLVPAYIEGRNSSFFYNLSLWRKRFGIKANIEMILLPDEMVKQKGKKIKIRFGKEIPYEVFDKSKSNNEWAQLMKRFVYEMGAGGGDNFLDFLKRIG
jgi:putative hemolysin